MAENIIIKQAYFTNNQTVINSLNEFFSSGFKTKNFPFLDEDMTIDRVLEKIVTRLNAVDPTWLSDEGKYNGIIETINEGLKGLNPADGIYQSIVDSNNTTLIEAIDSYLGFKTLQFIADNFQEFGTFVNGIYTFELFTKPSQYANVMDLFSQPIKLEEIPDLDIEERIYDDTEYVDGLLSNDLITFPESMDEQTETERLNNRQDLMGVDILVDDAVQEAAEINYFVDSKPAHMKYSTKTKKWMVSNEFGRVVNDIVAGLRKCDTSEDLQKFFSDPFWKKTTTIDVCKVVAPYILVKALTNPKKSSSKIDGKKYTDSYASIIKQNKGAKRFQNYDLFSTFKSDKEGTIKFIEDFMKLNLVNDPNAYISNNTLLTLFNIFDSRIYLDLVYNITPENVRDGKTEDQFVKDVRGRINKNSRTKTAYSKEDTTAVPETDDAKQVQEFVSCELDKLGDMSISDMIHCEHFRDLVQSDIDNVDNAMYNAGLSQFLVEEYIGKSFYDINMFMDGVFQEADIRQKRETMQQGICSLMANMEEIVKMDKEHRWNANTLGSRYTQSINPWMFLGITPGSINNSSEAHTNIKQVYHSTKKAMNGKRGNFTQEQIQTLTQLNELTGKLWGCVKMFWINPRNILKEFNLFKNDKTQKRTRMIADIARQIVALKPQLKFVMDNDNFVNEAWYDGSPDYIFQEATTEDNRKRLVKAVDLVMRDMKEVKALVDKNQWTNAAAKSKFKTLLSTFAGRTEQYCNVKEGIKYLERAKANAAGALTDNEQRVVLDLLTKLKEIQKCARRLGVTGMEIGANIKESPSTHKIGQLASEIVAMESELKFINDAPKKELPEAEKPSDEKKEDGVKTESYVFQESKQTHMKRTLKKFDYDPKTDTILTDITMPGGKEKMRAKLIIDNDIDEPYMCFEEGKPVIYVRRKDLKQKSWFAAFTLRHEEGHIAHGHGSGDISEGDTYSINVANVYHKDSKGEFNKAKAFLDKKWKTASEADKDNEHDWKPEELMADKYAAQKTSRKTSIKSLERMYKEGERRLKQYEQEYHDIINRSKKKDKSDPERAKLRKEYKDLESKFHSLWKSNPSDEEKEILDNITERLEEIDELLVDREEVDEAQEAIESVKENIAAWRAAKNRRIEYVAKHVNEYGVMLDIDAFKFIMEQETGEIPEYMKTRLKMSDKIGGSVTPAGIPSGVPQNPIPDLADSIDTKVNSGGDTLGDMLGSGFENNPNKPEGDDKGKIVVNVTNNYNNSFNRDSNNTTTNTTTTDDHSQGKVTTSTVTNNESNNNSSHDNQTDKSSNKTIKKTYANRDSKSNTYSTNSSGSNNNNNSNGTVDTKDSVTSKDNEQKLSSGMSVQEMFMFLESKEPQSMSASAKPPKEDLLSNTMHKAMDRDRALLKNQQGAKKTVTNIANTGKAVLKPVTRTKQWLTKVVDSLIKRDEDKVKAELLENDSYRSIVFKAARLSLKLGLTAIFFSIQPYLGMTYVAIEGLRMADKHRLKKEMGKEMEAELDIINEKIRDLESIDTVEARKQKYEYMRIKKKAESYFIRSLGSGYLKHPKDA